MIGKLTGIVDSVGSDYVILDVCGVGYVCHCSSKTLLDLPLGETVSLVIETYVREEQLRLFGFGSDNERDWFRLLLTVQGVGNRAALSILSVIQPKDLAMAIALQDIDVIVNVPGIGKKLAERIIIELRDKASELNNLAGIPVSLSTECEDSTKGDRNSSIDDAISALTNLGYSHARSVSVVIAASRQIGVGSPAEHLIRVGLQQLAR